VDHAAATEGVREQARAWLADDPDPTTRQELRAVLDRGSAGDADLQDRFAGTLQFGTAGLRGPVRAGPNGMNRAVVRAAAAGLVAWLTGRDEGPIAIGYDARNGSAEFAEETARVVTGAGREALVLPAPLPTPVLAYAVRHLAAAAGVVVTASHNPPADNGYKVYLGPRAGGPTGNGAQIVPPVDGEIEAAIRSVGPLADVPLGGVGTRLDDDIVASYVRDAAALVDPDAPRDLSIAYTPLHGVGAEVVQAAFAAAGFPSLSIVEAQARPDPAFPTVAFPNPEEPGAIDLVVDLARRDGADIAIANDPDADRCAVAVPAGDATGGWRMLRGDDVGILLADHLMRRGRTGRYATTIVSSSLLGAVCAKRGHPYAETLTGFKWIVRAGGDDTPLAYGYEEALGYCVAPDQVRDKDGITAALMVAELAATLKARSQTLTDRLDEIAAEFGVYATDQVSIRVADLNEIDAMMRRVRADPPKRLLDDDVSDIDDRSPDNDVVTVRTNAARVVVRPSGTEPKLKAYLQIVEPVTNGDVPAARKRAAAALDALRAEIVAMLGA
jgi:phosphomannomutase